VEFEHIAGPFTLTEGPAWDGGGLLFTDIGNNRVLRYDPSSGSVETVRTGTNAANGLMLDRAGRLYACEGKGRRIVRYEPDGGVTVIADRYEGKRLNSPNDLAIDAQGRIWFTDPRYGDDYSDMELDHESVFRLDPPPGGDGQWSIRRMTYDTTKPNGLLISPDQQTLYVAQSDHGADRLRELRAYPIDGDQLGSYRVLHDFGLHRGIDGMCLDTEGNILATAGFRQSGPGPMVYVFGPDGRVLEQHPFPQDRPTNCTFGDADLRTLYVTSIEGWLYRARTSRRGRLWWPPS
jgi:gluconolactonase